jgi:hypothetical protein
VAHSVLLQYFHEKTAENHKTSSQKGRTLGKNGTRIVRTSNRNISTIATKFCRLVDCRFVICDSFI